jgi:pyrroloquinoline quinone (PQQ) biosynthesis protein C
MSTDNIIKIGDYIEQSDAEGTAAPDTYEWEVSARTLHALELVLKAVPDEKTRELIENYASSKVLDAFGAAYRFGHKDASRHDE